ncbi:MAG: hypothetical protein VXW73_00895 [Actinomycetota bacterium]|nr:hypothetical protein [Actinomycetota bacterium]
MTIANAPLPVASKLLGRKKISTTVDVYGHLMEADSRAAIDALRDAISGKLLTKLLTNVGSVAGFPR